MNNLVNGSPCTAAPKGGESVADPNRGRGGLDMASNTGDYGGYTLPVGTCVAPKWLTDSRALRTIDPQEAQSNKAQNALNATGPLGTYQGWHAMPPRETWGAIDAMGQELAAILRERDELRTGRDAQVSRLKSQLEACGETIAKLQAENTEWKAARADWASPAEATWLRDKIKRKPKEEINWKTKAEYWQHRAEVAQSLTSAATADQKSRDEWQRVLADANRRAQDAAAQRDDVQAALTDLRESHRANLAIIAKLRAGSGPGPTVLTTDARKGDVMHRAITATLAGWRPVL